MLTLGRSLLALGLAWLLVPACSPSPPPPDAEEGRDSAAAPRIPSGRPYIQGQITALERDGVRIEERPGDEAGSAKAVLTLNPQTVLVHRSGRPALPTELRPGVRVSAWVEGAILESYPVQATASALVVEPDRP